MGSNSSRVETATASIPPIAIPASQLMLALTAGLPIHMEREITDQDVALASRHGLMGIMATSDDPRLAEPARVPFARLQARQHVMQQVLRSLLIDLDEAEVPATVLKGPALDAWAYQDTRHRTFTDLDLLVPQDRVNVVTPLQPNFVSNTILIVGSFFHAPNVRGLDYFLSNIWPTILRAAPQARLRIVGRYIPEAQWRAWSRSPQVDIVGFVDDLTPEYERAAFTIAPIYEGGGTNIKVIELLMYGRRCVSTPHACRGYESLIAAVSSPLFRMTGSQKRA